MENKNCFGISVFGYEDKKKCPIYVSKKCYEGKHSDILLIEKRGKKHYFLIKDSNLFMNNYRLHAERAHFLLLFTSF